MKTFTRFRTIDELRTECMARHWPQPNTDRFDKAGSDYITIRWHVGRTSGTMLVSMFNGRFFGELDKGGTFSSDSTTHENTAWFKALLATVYI